MNCRGQESRSLLFGWRVGGWRGRPVQEDSLKCAPAAQGGAGTRKASWRQAAAGQATSSGRVCPAASQTRGPQGSGRQASRTEAHRPPASGGPRQQACRAPLVPDGVVARVLHVVRLDLGISHLDHLHAEQRARPGQERACLRRLLYSSCLVGAVAPLAGWRRRRLGQEQGQQVGSDPPGALGPANQQINGGEGGKAHAVGVCLADPGLVAQVVGCMGRREAGKGAGWVQAGGC